MKEKFAVLREQIRDFLDQHTVGAKHQHDTPALLAGDFSLYPNASAADLYGMVDMVYTLFTLGELPYVTDRASRAVWADKILACQDADGWFTLRNLRGHSREHATAYAIGALRLLALESGEDYLSRLKPLVAIRPLLTDRTTFERWLNVLDFRFSPRSILQKKLGWHYIWRGSHVGGGIPAAIGMVRQQVEQWWPGQVDVAQWFEWYFEWLDAQANPTTGYWQRAFWNLFYRQPTLIDMGGAVHFFWIYDALGRPFPYPETVVKATLSLQRADGLYKDHPFCIDLDGNFCTIRAYLQLPEAQQVYYQEQVYHSAEKNFEAIIQALTTMPLTTIYKDSHGLPGALAALVECTILPGFKYGELLVNWRHPLDKVWWL